MDIKAANAANAYADALKRAIDSPKSGDDDAASGLSSSLNAGQSFSDMVVDALEGAVKTEKAGETAAIESLAGKSSLVDVVTAVTNAEITLQTVVAVRDRVIGAYQEIIRMPI